jgi:hypothetical protein
MEDPEAGGAARIGSRPQAAVVIDRTGAQRIADCGDYRMAEVMPTNCLWRASRVHVFPLGRRWREAAHAKRRVEVAHKTMLASREAVSRPSVARESASKPPKKRRDQPGVRQERTRVPYFFLPFFLFLSFFLDLSFFG